MSPAITVIITHYNHRAYLMDAVQSIINQTFQNWELIIMNDDPDVSMGKYGRILDKRIGTSDRLIHKSKRPVGQSVLLNIAIDLASGKYIAFQDADDISFNYRLQMSYDKIIFDHDLIYGDKILLYPNSVQKYWNSPEWDKFKLCKKPMGCWGSYMVRAKLAKKIKFDPTVKWGNDHLWEAEIAKRTDRIAKIDDLPLYKQRTWTSTYRKSKIPLLRKINRIRKQRAINERVRRIIEG